MNANENEVAPVARRTYRVALREAAAMPIEEGWSSSVSHRIFSSAEPGPAVSTRSIRRSDVAGYVWR